MIRSSLTIFVLLISSTIIGCSGTSAVNSTETDHSPAENSTVRERVKSVVALQLGLDESKFMLTDALQEKLGADELDLVELVMELEEEFNVTIPDDAFIEDGKSVFDVAAGFSGEDLARIVQQQLANGE